MSLRVLIERLTNMRMVMLATVAFVACGQQAAFADENSLDRDRSAILDCYQQDALAYQHGDFYGAFARLAPNAKFEIFSHYYTREQLLNQSGAMRRKMLSVLPTQQKISIVSFSKRGDHYYVDVIYSGNLNPFNEKHDIQGFDHDLTFQSSLESHDIWRHGSAGWEILDKEFNQLDLGM